MLPVLYNSTVVSVVKDRQHRIDVVSVRNLCAMIVFFFSKARIKDTIRIDCCEKSMCMRFLTDRQHLRIDVVSVRNLCAMIVFQLQ